MDLTDIRKQIDQADAELAELFQRRAALSMQAAIYKKENGLPLGDAGRERDILIRAEGMARDEGMKPALRRLFVQVLEECRQKQRDAVAEVAAAPAPAVAAAPRQNQDGCTTGVAFLGPAGSFSHEAALGRFGGAMEERPMPSFEEAAEAVASGACRYGVLPVENSLTGGVFPVIDLMTGGKLKIVGETVLAVRHCLLGMPGAEASGVKAVLSHAQPLEQCRKFIRRMGLMVEPCGSTAEAARRISALGDPALAAIASEAAGRMYGLVPLMRDIQDNPANFTRFAVVANEEYEGEDADKITAVFVVEHRPGTLYGALRAFADRGINLLNLISRPVPGSPWQYCFHMDFDGSLGDANVQAALRDAGTCCSSIRVLGNYRKWRGAL